MRSKKLTAIIHASSLCETTTVAVIFVTLKVLYCSLYRCVLRRLVVCLCSVLFEFSTVEDIFNDRRRQEEWTNRWVIFLESWLLFAYFALINGKDYGIGTLHYTYRTITVIHLHAPIKFFPYVSWGLWAYVKRGVYPPSLTIAPSRRLLHLW